MRDLLLPLAALALAMPATAWAEGGCPEKAAADVITALGTPAGTLGSDQSIYQPAGATVLGLPVSYVVVTKASGGAVEEIDYRLQGVMRKYSEHYPAAVLQAFDKAYPGVGCATGHVTACAFVYETKGAPPDQLANARITDPGLDVPKNAQEPALAAVKTDYARQDSGPVFLACLYNAP